MLREARFPARDRNRPVSILLVEDDPAFAELIHMQLRRLGWTRSRLDTAGTLRDAQAKVAEAHYGLIITDLNLPDSSGIDTVAALARGGEHLVIVLTGDADSSLRAAALEHGAYDFLSKDDLSSAALERLVRLAAIQASTHQSLRKSEGRFRSLVHLSSDWYWEQDEDLRFTSFEGPTAQADGNHPERAIGKRRWEIEGIMPVSCTWEEHRAALEARQSFRGFEYLRIGDDGLPRYISTSGEPIYQEGAFRGYRGIASDITSRKRSEEELGRFRLALDASPDMILLIDRASMRIIDANTTVCSQLGYSREEFLAMGPQDVLPVTRKELEMTYDRMIADPSTVTGMRSYYRCKDGSQLPFESTRRVMRAGEKWIIAVISRDIREHIRAEDALRASEARFRSLTALSSDLYWEQDAEYRFVSLSGTGAAPARRGVPALMGKRRWECAHVFNMTPADWAAHKAILDQRKPFYDLELGIVDESGRQIWRSVSGEPVFDDSGAFKGYRGIGKEITARKKEERLYRLENVVARCLETAAETASAMPAVIRAICVSEGLACGRYFAPDDECHVIRFAHGWGVSDTAVADFLEQSRSLAYRRGTGLVGAAWESGQPRWVNEDKSDAREGGRSAADGFPASLGGAVLVLPVAFEGSTFGVFTFHSQNARDLDERVMRALQAIAVHVAQFEQRKLAQARQAAHLLYQRHISRLGQSALAKRDANALIEEAVQILRDASRAEAVAYFEGVAGSQEAVLRAAAPRDVKLGGVACAQESLLGRALRADATLQARGEELLVPWAAALGRVALVPVLRDGARGALCAGFERPGQCPVEKLNFLEAAASILSTGLQRIDSEGRVAYLAQFDPLTGLPNRALLADRFSSSIAQARRQGSLMAVLFIDLDGFKAVNDSLGHAAGDDLLKEVAVRLQAAVRAGDTVARISGDEFAIVLADLGRPDDAALVAEKIIDRVGLPVQVHGHEVFVTASVGIASFPADGADAEALIGAADAAMYRAKQSGRGAFQFFTAEINQRSRARAQMAAELRRALERAEFTLAYQPKYELASRKLCGAEALLRWNHPRRGVVSPAEFIPVLEETGLIVPVGEWVLRQACADLEEWRAAGLPVPPVAINLSARQLRLADLDVRLKAIISSTAIPASLLELEITESQLMHDPDQAIRLIRSLREAGMRIAIDDFGTGYSSLSYLTRFPVSALKIDRSFVAEVHANGSDATIVRTIIEMANALGLTVIAEGIETEAQLAYLCAHGCEQGQGYLFGRPAFAADFRAAISASIDEIEERPARPNQ